MDKVKLTSIVTGLIALVPGVKLPEKGKFVDHLVDCLLTSNNRLEAVLKLNVGKPTEEGRALLEEVVAAGIDPMVASGIIVGYFTDIAFSAKQVLLLPELKDQQEIHQAAWSLLSAELAFVTANALTGMVDPMLDRLVFVAGMKLAEMVEKFKAQPKPAPLLELPKLNTSCSKMVH